jgi:hypothetical protein
MNNERPLFVEEALAKADELHKELEAACTLVALIAQCREVPTGIN